MYNSYKFNQVKYNSKASVAVNKTVLASLLLISLSLQTPLKKAYKSPSALNIILSLGASTVIVPAVITTTRKPRWNITKHNEPKHASFAGLK